MDDDDDDDDDDVDDGLYMSNAFPSGQLKSVRCQPGKLLITSLVCGV